MRKSTNHRYKKFSRENVEYLCREIHRMEESQLFLLTDFVEMLRELTEVIIWSDKNAEFVFDSFLEWGMMSTFERVVTNAELPSEVKVQTIQCITMMLQNLTRKSSVYFVCSNNHLNRIISLTFDENDDELLSTYVSFLKSLALRLNEDTVQFFFERVTGAFPLFDRASKLLAAPDRMVRAAARQIVLSIAQLTEPAIIVFLERALRDVFSLIATLLWSQIKELGEAAAEYSNVERYSAHTSQLLGVTALSDRFEDVVDDLFYINDLFAVPHAFVPLCLESVLDKVVISPLLASLEVQTSGVFPYYYCDYYSSSTFSASSVSTPTALCVLTRWILLNKTEQLQHLFRKRLLTHVEKDGGVVGRVLRSGCMQNLSGAVMLLDAMVSTGLFTEHKTHEVECVVTNDLDNVVRELLEGTLALGTTDIIDESWSLDQQLDVLLPLPKPWATPSCAVFVDSTCGQMEHAITRCWCECLMAAFYHFITSSACARLSIVDTALDLIMGFARDKQQCASLLRGLLFLCLTVVQRRTVMYAERLEARKNDGVVSSTTSTTNNDKSGWLRSSYEVLFVKLSYVCQEFEAHKAKLRRDLSKEVGLLLPLLPSLNFLQTQQTKNNNNDGDGGGGGGSGSSSSSKVCLELVLRKREEYISLQKSIAAMVAYQDRAAHDRSEEERSDFLIWMTLRHYAHQVLNEEDAFLARLCGYGVCQQIDNSVSVLTSARMCCRCELVKGRLLFGTSPAKAAAGTPMYMVLYNTKILFLAAGNAVPHYDPTATFRVMFSLQMIYVQAVVSRAPFSVVITHAHPDTPLQLHVVFRHRRAATLAVDMMTRLSLLCRSNGAALVFRVLNPQECRSVFDARPPEPAGYRSSDTSEL